MANLLLSACVLSTVTNVDSSNASVIFMQFFKGGIDSILVVLLSVLGETRYEYDMIL